MRTLVFFLEEASAREMLKGLLPRFLPSDVESRFVVFEGKQDGSDRTSACGVEVGAECCGGSFLERAGQSKRRP